MSYILDALKKADAQRERGHIPGLAAQPASVGLNPDGSGRSALRYILAGGLLLSSCLLVVWGWRQGLPTPPDATPAATPAKTSPATAIPATPPVLAVADPAPAAYTPRPGVYAADRPALTAAVPVNPAALAAPPRLDPAPGSAAPAGEPAALAPKAAARSQAEEQASALPLGLPKLTISGSTYSHNPAHRMLIVNGQVVRENEQAGDQLQLIEIQQKAAIFSFKGQRFTQPY